MAERRVMGKIRGLAGVGSLRLVMAAIVVCGTINTAESQTNTAESRTAAESHTANYQKAPQIKLDPCTTAVDKEARCGKYLVYEDREAKSGRQISLNILVLPALTPKPAPDPVFFLEGGPGVSAVNTAKIGNRKGLIDKWRAERDVVFVDQRGTGESNPLQCDTDYDPDDMTLYFSTSLTTDKVAQCRDKLAKS